MRFK